MSSWWWWVVLIFTGLAIVFEAVALVKSPRYRPIHFAGLCILLYLAFLFGLVVFGGGVGIYLVRTGFMTAIGLVLLLLLHIADIIITYRCK